MYGTTDTIRHAKAAQVRNRPVPSETMMLRGTLVGVSDVFMTCDFLIITVHILAAIKSNRLPNAENTAETKKVRLFLATPLLTYTFSKQQMSIEKTTDVNKASAAQMVPSKIIQ